MPETTAAPELTADDCVRIFHAALAAGDIRGVEAALTVLAVRDPHCARELHEGLELAMEIARGQNDGAD